MSRVRANTVTNFAGTGTPSLPYGIQVGTGATVSGGTNTILASTNGSERVRIDSAGSVGIATNNTSYANSNADDLVIGSSSSSTERGITLGSSVASAIRFADAGNASAGMMQYVHDAGGTDYMNFYTVATERMRLDGSGRLLIGGTSPYVSDTNLQITDDTNPKLVLNNPGNSTYSFAVPSDQSSNLIIRNEAQARDDFCIEYLNGKVGIGTDNPSSTLQVTNQNGGGNIDLGIALKDDQYQYINFGATSNGQAGWQIGRTISGTAGIAGTSNGFYIYNLAQSEATIGINTSSQLVVAPSGMVIRSGFYGTGYGSGSRTELSSPAQTWTIANINGTNQVTHNIGKFSDDGITYDKVSNNSHLSITVSFPWYMAPALAGFGVRIQFSIDGGSNYYTLSGLTDGVAEIWGAGGYGGNPTSDASTGVFNYTYNTRMNTARASSILSHTGQCRLYCEIAIWNVNDTLTFIDYDNTFPKTGTITIQEIAE
jgi:hypothetical protein